MYPIIKRLYFYALRIRHRHAILLAFYSILLAFYLETTQFYWHSTRFYWHSSRFHWHCSILLTFYCHSTQPAFYSILLAFYSILLAFYCQSTGILLDSTGILLPFLSAHTGGARIMPARACGFITTLLTVSAFLAVRHSQFSPCCSPATLASIVSTSGQLPSLARCLHNLQR